MDKYVKSQHGKTAVQYPPPMEMIEISLYDRFGWTPEDVDKIDYGRLQRMMLVLKQMEMSEEAASATGAHAPSTNVDFGERVGVSPEDTNNKLKATKERRRRK